MNNTTKLPLAAALGLLLTIGASGSIAAPIKGSPADGGVINKEQVLYWLIKRGEVADDATEEAKNSAVDAFIARGLKSLFTPSKFELKTEASIKASKVKQARMGMQSAVMLADEDITKTVKVLGVLVDFPDLRHNDNRLASADTDMFYSSYPVSHYQNLLFSTSGFTGPDANPATLQSAYQYFKAASGQSFTFSGNVINWVTADNNAAYYGGNDADNDDNDSAVPELVKEAVVKAITGMSDAELATYDIEDPYDLDGDGNTEEADGIIDHIMLFHSSVGEEAGGGVLGTGAIWSHRFFVNTDTEGYKIPGRNMKIYGYTVQPIDAAAGVCTHEFGHDLGLPDEYDTSNIGDGSPVGSWSLMSGGSWTGNIAGSEPTGFSPYARSYLQQKYKGKWVKEQEVALSSIDESGLSVNLAHAVDANNVNQISIPLPISPVEFTAPYAGEYQYYSGQGDDINQQMSFNLTLPSATPLSLAFQAHWSIEDDYDYMQLKVNGVAIAGNYTKASNPLYGSVKHYISGKSSDIGAATGANSWIKLSYDLADFVGKNVTISMHYVTDTAEGDYGFVVDELELTNNISVIYNDDAETASKMILNGFSRVDDTRPGKASRYIVQLRSHQGIDKGLVSHGYIPGVLVWLENFNQADNNVSNHPGEGLIGVIDADQNLIGQSATDTQIRDAAFSQFVQSSYPGDNHLSANSMFDDSNDYSAPLKPQAGIQLTELGLTMEVTAQSANSTSATVEFKRSSTIVLPPSPLSGDIVTSLNGATVSFNADINGGDGNYQYTWTFGDNLGSSSVVAPSYTYALSGDYVVKLMVTDGEGNKLEFAKTVRVVILPTAAFSASATNLVLSITNNSSNGFGGLTYVWQFGDGNNSTATSPTHTYAQAGTYTITLVVTDTLGNTQTVTKAITVSSPVVITPPVVTPPADSGGGGSLGWLSLFALALCGVRRRI
ncbi:immune inhibitor A domain-containing protein [Shewanella sp. HL-SH8]|uniref:immune inhibitor A domain-containing protein n=1 Tax=Shewanella sp. HL-SH8 TaxID=3436242 RepID=UPI003EBA5CF6